MFVDLVEYCYGFKIKYNNSIVQYEIGDKYLDGNIVDCFVHHESGCVFMVIECGGCYFRVDFDEDYTYELISESGKPFL